MNIVDSSWPLCDSGVDVYHTEIERLADLLLPSPNKHRHMAVLAQYGDESATPRIFGVAVFIATIEKWVDFDTNWRDVLRRAELFDLRGQLLPFHMADFESRYPPFDNWDDTKRIRVLGELISIINETFMMGIVSSIPLDLYKHYLPINSHLQLDQKLHRVMQYMCCLYRVHEVILHWMGINPRIERMLQIFDRNRHVTGMVQGVHDTLAETSPFYDHHFGAPIFENKAEVVQLQAADVLAYEAVKHRDNKLLESGRHLRKSFGLLDRKRIIAADCNDKYLIDVMDKFYEHAVTSGLITRANLSGES